MFEAGGFLAVWCALSAAILAFFGGLILGNTVPYHILFEHNDQDRKSKGIGVLIASGIYVVFAVLGVVCFLLLS